MSNWYYFGKVIVGFTVFSNLIYLMDHEFNFMLFFGSVVSSLIICSIIDLLAKIEFNLRSISVNKAETETKNEVSDEPNTETNVNDI